MALLAMTCPAVRAIDHSNLDEGRPLRVEDPYALARGEWAIEAGAGYDDRRRGDSRGLFPVEVLYGAALNLQVGVGATFFSDPHATGDPERSGDLRLSGLYNFNQETLGTPAFGARLTLDVPTGVDSSGLDVEVRGLTAKSFGRLALHLNAAMAWRNGAGQGERDGSNELIVGGSYPIGAPMHTRTVIIADLFSEQAPRPGEPRIEGAEVGLRHQLRARSVLDVGIGTEFSGSGDRSSFFSRAGVSFGF